MNSCGLERSIAVSAESAALREAAERLARELHLPLLYPLPEQSGCVLLYTAAGLLARTAPGKRLLIDFASGELRHRRLHGANRASLLARAVGAKHARNAPRVIDATAGLGRDAFILASLGCEVMMLERSPALWALLRDALIRAAASPDLRSIAARLTLRHADAAACLQASEACRLPPADVVYIDPMFPAEKRSALVKQEMRVLRELVGEDCDAPRLLHAAEASGIGRIVVKRMKNAPPLVERRPAFSVSGKTNRFDVYLR